MSKGWIGVDLDGTLAHYEKWTAHDHIGEPIEAMVNRVRDWIFDGWEVRIFTARACEPRCIEPIKAWCRQHIGMELAITNQKDLQMVQLWDDRCVQVVPNTGMPLTEWIQIAPLPTKETE